MVEECCSSCRYWSEFKVRASAISKEYNEQKCLNEHSRMCGTYMPAWQRCDGWCDNSHGAIDAFTECNLDLPGEYVAEMLRQKFRQQGHYNEQEHASQEHTAPSFKRKGKRTP